MPVERQSSGLGNERPAESDKTKNDSGFGSKYHCIGGAVGGIGPNVGRASKQVRKGERFPRAKGKCDHGGITTPPHHQTLLYHVTCILFDDTGCIMYLSHQKLNQVHHILHYARPFFPYTIHMSFFCITCNAGNTI